MQIFENQVTWGVFNTDLNDFAMLVRICGKKKVSEPLKWHGMCHIFILGYIEMHILDLNLKLVYIGHIL